MANRTAPGYGPDYERGTVGGPPRRTGRWLVTALLVLAAVIIGWRLLASIDNRTEVRPPAAGENYNR